MYFVSDNQREMTNLIDPYKGYIYILSMSLKTVVILQKNLAGLYQIICLVLYTIYSTAQNYKNKQNFLVLAAFVQFFVLFI